MRLFKKVWRSRLVWFIVGIILGLFVIPNIPAGSVGDLLKFLWAQKWGILIGALVIIVVTRIKRGSFKYKIVRAVDEDEGSRR